MEERLWQECRGMAMDRFITRTFRSLPAWSCRSERIVEITDTGVRGLSRRGVGHEARCMREVRLPSTPANGQGCQQPQRHSFHPCGTSLRPRTSDDSCRQSAFSVLCLPSWPDTNFSPLLISRKAPCGLSQRTLGAARRPYRTRFSCPASWQSRGGFQDTTYRVPAPAQGGSRFGIADFPLRQDTFLGSC
jgi:hypothetical protein